MSTNLETKSKHSLKNIFLNNFHNIDNIMNCSGGYSNSGGQGKNFQKLMFSRKKRALISSFTFFSQDHGDL